ncbi:hypothetical protein [Williamsia sp. CHRR-6]|uniref:hypothetical protein n=1 Tax=Williamsia sp. CHRR-6 TaxID=2835871 RepID=UPI001BD928E1|nr:hypothetical protein [Williamsia sp. CHRR-6]MBT0567151.1 hypothetical protein [Williamsia sp. CHRR-6]
MNRGDMMARCGRGFRAAYAAVSVTAVLVVAGCSDGSPSVEKLPTSAGVVKDSIEDVNSNKDMTGVVTTIAGDRNPYVRLIPYVCKFLPDSVTKALGMVRKQNAFGGQHKFLQACSMQSEEFQTGGSIGLTISVQASTLAEVTGGERRKILKNNIELGSNVLGTSYKLDGDDGENFSTCNVVWGTFYGTAVSTVIAYRQGDLDSCSKAIGAARAVLPYLPRKPIQMRAN